GRTLFQRIFAGPAGIDPYAAATSDVYQDLLGEGSYTGKGIYDVAAFTAALKGRVPENSLLSHDLFEGIFARAGLVTDIELFEEFPTDYEVAAGRQYRWARGDWQLLPWLIKGDVQDGTRRGWLPLIGAWKIVDNLRRTLSPPAAWLTLVAAWTLPLGLAPMWTTFVLTTLGLTFLAHQAWLMADGIARTLGRVYLTRRRLLEWTTAAQAESDLSRDVTGVYRRMRGALILAVAGGLLVAVTRPESVAIAAPFLLLWGLSPLAAR